MTARFTALVRVFLLTPQTVSDGIPDMVRNIKIPRRTRWWMRRHDRKHGPGVVIREHLSYVFLEDVPCTIAVTVLHGTAHCPCGAVRPAYAIKTYDVSAVRSTS